MILLFPDLDTLRLALTSSIVPADVTLAPAAVSFDGDGRVYVEPTAALSKAAVKNLDRIGAKGSKRHASDAPEEVRTWLQILPVVKDTPPPQLSNQAPVLFELGADDLPTLVTEMLRLGNDRQSFRWFDPGGGPPRVLLRVIGPPYYTLLRATDRTVADGTTAPVRAYLERAPRAWVELGFNHPLVHQLKLADKQSALLREGREWVFLDDGPFQDVYDTLQFKLPAAPVGWSEAKAPRRMTVPLRLAAGNAADIPELWVLRENAVEQLDTLVRDSDDRLLARLMFAVATGPNGARTVVLRTRPSKLPPPALALEDAVGFKPFQKLTNLFLPAGRRLHPTLRRDAVRKLLADDPDRVVWLMPDADDGRFTPETIPDNAFRPMEDWVDYVIEAEQKPLAAWVEATRFDFDHFVCRENAPPKPKDPGKGKDGRDRDDEDDVKAPAAVGPQAKPGGKGKPGAKAEFLPAPPEVKPPSEWKIKREELEKRFLAVDGPLDSPERRAIWPELAAANAGLKDAGESAVCWLNALWETDPPPAEWLAGWLRGELPNRDGPVKADEFDQRLKAANPPVPDTRAFLACFLGLAYQQPVPAWLGSRLPAVQNYLEVHEKTLPVRAVWLASYRLSQLAGSDVLGLARVRDRLLLRLLNEGLNPERDLPTFLRYAGVRDSERLRVIRDKSLELHDAARRWIDATAAAQKHEPTRANLPYVDLLFAFALAKLGEATPARRLLEDARKVLEVPVPRLSNPQNDQPLTGALVKNFAFKAYRYRVEQALAGKPHAGQFPSELLAELEAIDRKGKDLTDQTKSNRNGPGVNPYNMAGYNITRLRAESKIFEPQEAPPPYADWTKYGSDFKKELAQLQGVREPAKLADRLRRLYKLGSSGSKATEDEQLVVLHEGLPLGPRVGEAFTVEMLELVPKALAPRAGAADTPEVIKLQGELIQRSLALAGHFDRMEILRKLMAQFGDLVAGKPEESRFKLVNFAAGQALRSLRKFGLRDEIDRFLTRLKTEVLQKAGVADLRKKYSSKPEAWKDVLQTLLNLAAGWLFFGLNDHAAPILDDARNELLGVGGVRLQPMHYTEVARAYVSALGQGPSESGLPRMMELFRKMDPLKIANTFTTSPNYSRLHLNLVEDTILALVSDEFALGATGRKWLDDDEYLVRRRVHRDMKRERDRAGV